MGGRFLAIAFAAAALTACGQASNDAINEKFDEGFSSSCTTAATGGGAPADLATRICDCALAKINEKYSTTEKLTLSPEEAQPLMAQCVEEAASATG